MTKSDLAQTLKAEGFRADYYDLDGGMQSDRLCLSESRGRWYVYYSERGLQWDKKEFATETEACEYLLAKLRRDPHARA